MGPYSDPYKNRIEQAIRIKRWLLEIFNIWCDIEITLPDTGDTAITLGREVLSYGVVIVYSKR